MRSFPLRHGTIGCFSQIRSVRHKTTLSPNLQALYDPPLPLPVPDTTNLNNKLIRLVKKARYGAARLVIEQLNEYNLPIHQDPAFESPALATLQKYNSISPKDGKIAVANITKDVAEEFAEWLHFTPDAHHPMASFPRNRPFASIYEWLFQGGVPSKKLEFVTEFGLLMASKGYHRDFILEVARLVAQFGSSKTVKAYFPEVEMTALHYYALRRRLYHSEPPLPLLRPFPRPPRQFHTNKQDQGIPLGYPRAYTTEDPIQVASRYRQAAVETCIAFGRFEEALFLAEQDRVYALPDITYTRFLHVLEQQPKGKSGAGGASVYANLIVDRVKELRTSDRSWRVWDDPLRSRREEWDQS